MKSKKVIIYGGNGFVGTHTAESLQRRGADVVCLSRRGHKPVYLKDQVWSREVRWCKGDASAPNLELLGRADAMVCTVGSPPLPTFSKKAFEHQFFMNGTCCINAIEASEQAGIKRIVLISASIPWPLQRQKFAYYKGKKKAFDAAQKFAESSSGRAAIVLKPGMITGKRRLNSGKVIRLDMMTAPFTPLMPWQFVPVEHVADCVSEAIFNEQHYANGLTVIENGDIKVAAAGG